MAHTENKIPYLIIFQDREFRNQAECIKKRIIWDLESRCYLDPSAVVR
jgi:hypothetical protein